MKILCMIILVLSMGCKSTGDIKEDKKDNNAEYEQVEDVNIIKSSLFYFWVITGGM